MNEPRIVAALALVPTPLLVLVSPAVRLYLGNQEDLHHQTGVLLPFVLAALVVLSFGAGLWSLSGRPLFRYLTWGYVLAGPFWLGFRFLSGLASELPSLLGLAVSWSAETVPGIVLWVGAWLMVSGLSSQHVALGSIAKPMALFGVLLLLGDVMAFTRGVTFPRKSSESGLQTAASWQSPTATGPNLYHVVLDELQTDVVDLLEAPELDRALSGFVYFTDNRAIYHSTVMSLSSTLTSSRYLYDRPRGRYIRDGFQDSSLVGSLTGKGYQRLAVVPSSDPISADERGFAHVIHHVDNFERSASVNSSAFRNLWVVANIPTVIIERLESRGWLSERTQAELRRTRAGRALTDAAPVASAMSFEMLIRNENILPAAGRYTFVHLLLPHSPYVLGEDCTYRDWKRSEDPVAQTACTLGLLADYLDELDKLGRFEGSLIVIHGDHGAPFRARGHELVRSRARTLSTPLFVKPPHRSRNHELVRCDADSTLLDLAPTLFEMLDLAPDPGHVGSSLVEAVRSCVDAP